MIPPKASKKHVISQGNNPLVRPYSHTHAHRVGGWGGFQQRVPVDLVFWRELGLCRANGPALAAAGRRAVAAGTRFSGTSQQRFWSVVGPSLVLIGLGVLIPRWTLFFGGAGIGWLIVSQFVLRGRVRMEYQSAIKALRRGDYAEAISFMDHLIAAEPDDLEHWRFRAELYRLAGDLPKAQADYEQMKQIDPNNADAYMGLAEVFAQQGQYDEARRYAEDAYQRQPQNWMTSYNLGMIEDRLGNAEAALHCLDETISLGVPSSRYWLLIRLWRARSFYRLGKLDEARGELDRMRKQTAGLREWQLVFESEHAAALRGMLEGDVKLAEELLNPQAVLERLSTP